MNLFKNKDNFLLIGIASIIWLLVAYRATCLGMTHDESASYVYLNDMNIIGFLWDKNAWPNANNHYINTLFFQGLTRIFGSEEFVIRFFSVFSFGLAAYFFILLLQRLSNKYIRLGAFAFVFMNPYFIDFFSLARGYASANAFAIMGIYYAVNYLEKENRKDLILTGASILLASLSLFSSVIFFPVLFGSVLLYFIFIRDRVFDFQKLISPILWMIGLGLLSMIFIFIPLNALSKNDEFKWGAETLVQCFQSLVNHSSYGQKYMLNDLFLSGFFICILLYSIYVFITRYKHDKLFFIVSMGFIIMILMMVLAKIGFNSFYPVERKTTMFVPWIGLIFFSMLDKISIPKNTYLGIGITGLMMFHYIKSFDSSFVREWWFDRDTVLFMDKIIEDRKSSGQSGEVKMQSHWMFWPSLTFYNKTKYPSLNVGEYKKDLDTSNTYDYFISYDSDFSLLQNKYDVIYKADTGITLFRLKK
jgi:hypothetical protein